MNAVWKQASALPRKWVREAIVHHLETRQYGSTKDVENCVKLAARMARNQDLLEAAEDDRLDEDERKGPETVSRDAEPAFTWGTYWWRCKYEIREAPPEVSEIPVRCIVAVPELNADGTYRKPEWYDVLTEWRANAPAKQPKGRDSAEQDYAPHVALVNLDPSKEEAVLRFVNKWGLLGLWRVHRYKAGAGLFASHKAGPRDWEGREEHSGWYIWDEFYRQSNKGLYMHSFCEPVELFRLAAEKYQLLYAFLLVAKGDDIPAAMRARLVEAGFVAEDEEVLRDPQHAVREAELHLSGWLQECAHPRPIYDAEKKAWLFGWQCNSLLGWVYLLTFLDLMQGRTFRRCARRNCGKLFIPTRPNRKWCSTACRIAESQASFRKRNPKLSGLRKYSESLVGSCP